MKITLPVKSLFTPSAISITAVAASFLAWSFPSFGVLRKGFVHREGLDLTSTAMLLCWYGMIFVCFVIGQMLGSLAVRKPLPQQYKLFNLDSNLFYAIFTIFAVLGIGSTVIRIFSILPLQQALVYISLGQANELKDTLYQDYSIGLVPLRYLVLYPASIALYRIIRHKRYSLFNLFNVLLLAIGTFLSSRLILMATALATTFLLTYGRKIITVRPLKVALIAAVMFLILAVLNMSRNAGYYERNNQSFGVAGLSEILAYVGSPFQVAVGSAKFYDRLAAGLGDDYRDYTDIEINLNTNSAFTLLLQQMGYMEWPYFALVCLVMGFTFSSLASLGKTIFLLPCAAILYASAEIWRLDLFQQGTFVVWLVIGAGFPAALLFFHRTREILRKAPPEKKYFSPGDLGL